MGQILSRLKGKETSKEKLEKIDDEIRSLEDIKFFAIKQQKNLFGLLFLVSIFVLIISIFILYFRIIKNSDNTKKAILYCLPFILLPIAVIYLLKQALQWYYHWKIDTKDERLRFLRKEKKKILEKVMETETYKVAKELLEKYDPSALKTKDEQEKSFLSPSPNLRYRNNVSPTNYYSPSNQTLNQSLNQTMNQTRTYTLNTPIANRTQPTLALPTPRLARPIVSQDRTVVDKIVDYMVGDGPNNRYALICIYCNSHNGMALQEEFPYLSFRCCYCFGFNKSRKERPNAPPLNYPVDQVNKPAICDASSVEITPVIDEPESENESQITIKSLKTEDETSYNVTETIDEEESENDSESPVVL